MADKATKPFSLRLAYALVGVTAVMFILHLVLQYLNLIVFEEQHGMWFELSNRFDFDDEISVPTWFSQILLFSIGVVGLLAAYLQAGRPKRRLWTAIGTLALVLSVDERAALHELALQSLHNEYFLDVSPTARINAWWLLAPLVILVASGLAWWSIRLLPKRTVYLFIIGGTIFIAGAVVVDALSAGVSPYSYLQQGLLVGIEETLEILGSVIILYAITDHIDAKHHDMLGSAIKKLKTARQHKHV